MRIAATRRITDLLWQATMFVLLPALAFAEGAEGDASICPGNGLAARFIPCIRDKISTAAYNFFDQVYPTMAMIINIVLLISVIFFGVALSLGTVKRAGKATLVTLIKYGAVVMFTANLPMIFDWSIKIMDGLIEIVSTFKFNGGTLHCPIGDDFNSVWGRIDCVINSLIGINGDGKGLSQLAKGMLSFLFGSLTSGAVGVLIFLVGAYMVFNVTLSLLRAAMMYLLAVMMLTLVVLSGLFFIPLLAFKSFGYSYFERWVKMLISMIMQPVIVFAFLNIVLVALDVTMFSGQGSVFRTIAGDAVDSPDFSLNQYMEDNDLYLNNRMVFALADISPAATNQTPGAPTTNFGYGGSNVGTNNKPVNRNDPGSVPLGIEYRAIDFAKMAEVRKGGPALPDGDRKQAMLWAMASAILLAGVVSYLLIQLLGYMPKMAQDLGGGSKEGPDIGSRGFAIPGEQFASRGLTGATRQIEGLIGRRGGAQ